MNISKGDKSLMESYFLIHGSYGNPYKNWLPWLKSQLSKRKLNCIVPNFPSPYKQDYESWGEVLKAYWKVGYITENTTFITHSLGGIFIVKFLIENHIKIKKMITVAGFNNIQFEEDNSLYDSFYMDNNQLQKLKDICGKIICIFSDNDPYVPIKEAEKFAENLNAEKVEIKNAGHFNEKSGYKEFKEILEYI